MWEWVIGAAVGCGLAALFYWLAFHAGGPDIKVVATVEYCPADAADAGEPLPCPYCAHAPTSRATPTAAKYEGPEASWGVWCDNRACPTQPEVLADSQGAAVRLWNQRPREAALLGLLNRWHALFAVERGGTEFVVINRSAPGGSVTEEKARALYDLLAATRAALPPRE